METDPFAKHEAKDKLEKQIARAVFELRERAGKSLEIRCSRFRRMLGPDTEVMSVSFRPKGYLRIHHKPEGYEVYLGGKTESKEVYVKEEDVLARVEEILGGM